ncbi:hypothetical protein GBA52_021370 [Prunus armeniaca]|nr:hypothetical protein GBA52_021370 [Prunus armeniaca]
MASLSTPLISLPRHPNSSSPTFSTDLRFSGHPALSLIDQCTSIKQLKQVHAQMLRTGVLFDPYSASKLISASALSSFSSLDYARQVFDQIPQPNVYTWNTLIRAYASSSDPAESILIFLEMLDHCSECPDKYTYPFAIKAASELRTLQVGRGFHGMAIKATLGSDIYILNSLVHFYGSCGDLDLARRVFVKTPKKDVVSWNSIITVFAQGNCPQEALELFKEMEAENVKPNDVTMVSVLSACAKKVDLEFGRWLDEMALRLKSNGYVPNKSHLLQFVEEEDMKDHALILHSEKLAIAFGLISLSPSQPIQVVKNLRVCGDCHSVAKLISKLYDREILLRDRYRFHHFRDGHCSCNDYW